MGPLLLIELTSCSIFIKEIPLNFDIDSIYKEFPWEFFFTWKSFVNFFQIFKLESDFFPHFFLQNQETRKLCTFIYLELKLSQFSRDLKSQKVGPHPPPTTDHQNKKKTAQRAWTPGRILSKAAC